MMPADKGLEPFHAKARGLDDRLQADRHLVVPKGGVDPCGRQWFVLLPNRFEDFAHLCGARRAEEHTSELQSLLRISYAVLCLKKKNCQSLTVLPRPRPDMQESRQDLK